ncbi:Phosphatidylinositol-4-phosphate 5-kinase, partial [Coemansia sp. RSA 2607]
MVLLAHQDATFSSRLSNNNYQTGSEYPRKESTIVTTSRQAAKTEPRIESGKRLSSAILTPVTGTSFDDGQFIVSGPLLPIRQSRRGINPNRNFRIVGSQAFMAAEMQHNPDAMNTMMAPPTPVSASVSSASYSSHVNDQMPELDSAESSANSSKSTISSEGVIASRACGMGKYDKHHIPSIQELPMDPVTLPYQHSGSAGISHHVPSSSSRAGHSYSSLNGVGEHEVRSSAVPVSALLPGARAAMRKSVSPTDSLVASGGMAVQQQYLVQRMPVRPQAETGERQSNESPSLSSSQIRLASPQIRVSNQAPRSLSPDTEMDAVHADTRSGTNGNGWSGSHDKEQTKVGREARDSWNLPSDDNSTRQTDRQRKRQGLQAPTTTEHFHVRPLNLAAANDHSLHGQPSLSTILTDSPVDAQYHTSSPLSASISMKSYHPMLTDYLYAASSADEMPAHSEKLHSQPSEAVLAEKSPSPRMRDPVHQRITHDHRATSFDLGHIGRASEHVFAKQNKHQLHLASGANSQHQSPVIRTASRISAGSGRASRLARAGTRSSERLASSSPRVQLDPGQHVEEGYEGDSEGMLNAGSWPPMQRRNTVACDKIDDTPSLSQWPTRVKPRNTGDFASMSLSKDDRRGLRGSRRRSTTNALTPIGTQIAPGHANYVLMYNMLTGIRVSVSRCEAKDSRPVRFDDYTAMHKYSFDVVGDEMTSSSRYDFKFKDYAPWVFRCIREAFHLSTEDYLVSLTDKYILSEVGSSGKSGS